MVISDWVVSDTGQVCVFWLGVVEQVPSFVPMYTLPCEPKKISGDDKE